MFDLYKIDCDCSIGHLYSYENEEEIHLSDVNDKKINYFQVDGRRCCMRKFNFCPNCGKKINWKNIKQFLK